MSEKIYAIAQQIFEKIISDVMMDQSYEIRADRNWDNAVNGYNQNKYEERVKEIL